jgi:hypothetical protein
MTGYEDTQVGVDAMTPLSIVAESAGMVGERGLG